MPTGSSHAGERKGGAAASRHQRPPLRLERGQFLGVAYDPDLRHGAHAMRDGGSQQFALRGRGEAALRAGVGSRTWMSENG